MTKKERALALLFLGSGLALAMVGQFYFFRRRDYLWDGLIFYALAVPCFVLAWRQAKILSRPSPASIHPSFRLGVWVRERPVPSALIALGLLLSLAATWLSLDRVWNQWTGDIVALWALGAGVVVLSAFWPDSRPSILKRRSPDSQSLPRPGDPGDQGSVWQAWKARLRKVERTTWSEMAVIAGLTLLALMLRVAALDNIPFAVGGDEAWHGLLARQVLDGELRNPFVMGYMSMPTFFYWPLSWSLWLVGNTLTALRLPAALAGTLTVPVLYLFARRLWGRRLAFLAALFLAGYDYHIHYSRLGANNVWDALFVLLTLWALDRGLASSGEVQQARAFTLAGVALGLSVYFYTGARLLPLLVVTYLGFLWVRRYLGRLRGTSPAAGAGRPGAGDGSGADHTFRYEDGVPGLHWRWVLLLVVAFLVTAGPMLGYAFTHPDEWNSRINQVGIIQSGWLAREPGITGKSLLTILAEQFLRSAGAFHVFADRTFWYGAERPLLDFLAGILAVLGMVWAVAHWRQRRYFLILIWFWSVIITGGMLTESPPSSQRLVIAIPAVALLVAIGLEQMVRLVQRLLGFRREWENVILGLVALVLVVTSVRFYFLDYTPARRYGSTHGETATMIGRYLRDLEGEVQVYFFGAPRIYWNFGSMTFLAPGVPGEDVLQPLTGPPDFVEAEGDLVFIFLQERVGESIWVQQAFPDGQLHEFRDGDQELRFLAYEIDR